MHPLLQELKKPQHRLKRCSVVLCSFQSDVHGQGELGGINTSFTLLFSDSYLTGARVPLLWGDHLVDVFGLLCDCPIDVPSGWFVGNSTQLGILVEEIFEGGVPHVPVRDVLLGEFTVLTWNEWCSSDHIRIWENLALNESCGHKYTGWKIKLNKKNYRSHRLSGRWQKQSAKPLTNSYFIGTYG